MRARLTDPMGPTWIRWAIPLFSMALAVLSAFGPWDGSGTGFVFSLSMAILFLGSLVIGRRPSRDVNLELGAGYIAVTGAGALNQRIHVRDIRAASTARGARGVGLALVRGAEGARPLFLDLGGEDGAKAVRDALGIGHFGLGTLTWPTMPRAIDRWNVGARLVGGAVWLFLATSALIEALIPYSMLSAVTLLPICSVLIVTALLSRASAGECIAMHAKGVSIRSARQGWEFVPYASIATVTTNADDEILLELHTSQKPMVIRAKTTEMGRNALSREERDHVVAQILSAAQRAHGEGEPPPAIGARVADLAKGQERARAWLARLDATAELLASGRGYRGAGFEEEDLWTTLEDHDAPADVRAASARVLLRVAPELARKRVASVLAAVRDEPARDKIRIAIEPDVEHASRELDEIEQRETRHRYVMPQ